MEETAIRYTAEVILLVTVVQGDIAAEEDQIGMEVGVNRRVIVVGADLEDTVVVEDLQGTESQIDQSVMVAVEGQVFMEVDQIVMGVEAGQTVMWVEVDRLRMDI